MDVLLLNIKKSWIFLLQPSSFYWFEFACYVLHELKLYFSTLKSLYAYLYLYYSPLLLNSSHAPLLPLKIMTSFSLIIIVTYKCIFK